MTLKKVEELQGNEILAKALTTLDYQFILHEGSVIKKEYVEKLKELGVREVWIKSEEEPVDERVILKSDIESSVKEKVKDILERHTYQRNKELAELSGTADNIITTILEEEQVIERVYDIKQRSQDIYEHSINTCSLAILTAAKLGLDKETIHDIGVGCLLHDIGIRYLAIDTDNMDIEHMKDKDLAEYKKHPVYGFTAVEKESWISKVSRSIILQHHERLDGSGYPLKARNLPVETRIVNICDTFDEMICGIACKRSKVHEAIEYLKNFKNSKFDGKIVDVFLGFTAVYPVGTHVMTNEGEEAIVLRQNKDFQDRPIIRILNDKQGEPVKENIIINLMEVKKVFIEKALD